MDLEQLALLDDDSKDHYVKLERMFDTQGWAVIEEWARVNSEAQFQRAAFAGSWEENRIALGARMVYEQIRTMRDSTEAEFAAKAEQAVLNTVFEDEVEHE
jgi:hypothetical protein